MSLSGMVKFDFSMSKKDMEIAKWKGVITIYYKYKPRKFDIECVGGFSPLPAL